MDYNSLIAIKVQTCISITVLYGRYYNGIAALVKHKNKTKQSLLNEINTIFLLSFQSVANNTIPVKFNCVSTVNVDRMQITEFLW